MNIVRALGVSLGMDNRQFVRGTEEASKKVESFGSKAFAASKKVALIGTAMLGAAGLIVRNVLKSADEIQKLTLRIGDSAEALSSYRHVAELGGVSFDQLTGGMQRFQRTIGEAAAGSDTAAEALGRVGLSVDELQKLSPTAQFEALADAIAAIEDPAERAAVAQATMGRSGVELLSVLTQGSDAIRSQREEAEKLGKVMSQDQVEAAARANDAMARMSAAFSGVVETLVLSFAPAIADTLEWIAEKLPRGIEIARDFISRIIETIMGAVTAFTDFVGAVRDTVDAVTGTVAGMKDRVSSTFNDMTDSVVSSTRNAVTGMLDRWRGGSDELVGNSIIPDMVDRIGENFERMVPLVVDPTREAVSTVLDLFDGLERSIASVLANILRGTQSFGDGLRSIFDGIVNDVIRKGTDAIANAIVGSFTGSGPGLSGLGGAIKGGLGGLFGGGGGMFSGAGGGLGPHVAGGGAGLAGLGAVAGPLAAFAGGVALLSSMGGRSGTQLRTRDLNRLLADGSPMGDLGGGMGLVGTTERHTFGQLEGQAEAMAQFMSQAFRGHLAEALTADHLVTDLNPQQLGTAYADALNRGFVANVELGRIVQGETETMNATLTGSAEHIRAMLTTVGEDIGGTFEIMRESGGETFVQLQGDADSWAKALIRFTGHSTEQARRMLRALAADGSVSFDVIQTAARLAGLSIQDMANAGIGSMNSLAGAIGRAAAEMGSISGGSITTPRRGDGMTSGGGSSGSSGGFTNPRMDIGGRQHGGMFQVPGSGAADSVSLRGQVSPGESVGVFPERGGGPAIALDKGSITALADAMFRRWEQSRRSSEMRDHAKHRMYIPVRR